MTGAFELVARIATWLAPGGTAVVTEFGDPRRGRSCRRTSITPSCRRTSASCTGRQAVSASTPSIEFVIDLLDFDRDAAGPRDDAQPLPRTARARRRTPASISPKIGYTPELLAQTVGDKLDLAHDRRAALGPHRGPLDGSRASRVQGPSGDAYALSAHRASAHVSSTPSVQDLRGPLLAVPPNNLEVIPCSSISSILLSLLLSRSRLRRPLPIRPSRLPRRSGREDARAGARQD